MSTIPACNVRDAANNPDGVFASELSDLIEFIGPGDWPAPQAADLFPDHPGPDRIRAAVAIRQYATHKLRAMARRSIGEIDKALTEEATCDRLYRQLPDWAKW